MCACQRICQKPAFWCVWSFGSPCGEAGPSLPHSEAALGSGPPGGVPAVGGSPVGSSYHHTWCPALPHRSRTGVADVRWEAGSTWGPSEGTVSPEPASALQGPLLPSGPSHPSRVPSAVQFSPLSRIPILNLTPHSSKGLV